MLLLNVNYYLAPDRAPQMHSGTADLVPDSGSGEAPMAPSGISSESLALLPEDTWGAAWASAPNPGQAGSSQELIAVWTGLPGSLPPLSADLRVPGILRVRDRSPSDSVYTSASAFKAAVAARQTALGTDVACWDATGTRYADLNTNFSDQSEGAETRDVYRESDNTKVGEAFIYRASATQTVQHWVLFNTERFDQVRVVKRTSGGYSSLSSFLSSLANQKGSGVSWPHAVETVTHYLSCPW